MLGVQRSGYRGLPLSLQLHVPSEDMPVRCVNATACRGTNVTLTQSSTFTDQFLSYDTCDTVFITHFPNPIPLGELAALMTSQFTSKTELPSPALA